MREDGRKEKRGDTYIYFSLVLENMTQRGKESKEPELRICVEKKWDGWKMMILSV